MTKSEPTVIAPEILYPIMVFKRISGLGDYALRSARRGGLRVLNIGGRRFVKGSDFIAYAELCQSRT